MPIQGLDQATSHPPCHAARQHKPPERKRRGNTIRLTSVTANVARRTTHIGDLRRSETQTPANHLSPSPLHPSPSRTTQPSMPMPGMEPDRLRRPQDFKAWPLCGIPRAGPQARRLPFPRRRDPSSMPSPTPTWHPPTVPDPDATPLIPDPEDTSPTTPPPSPPPAATIPPTPPPLLIRPPAPPPPPFLNSTRDPRPHRSGRLRHVKGMLGLRRMETIDEDDGILGPSSDVDGEEDGEEEVRVCLPTPPASRFSMHAWH
jgi:hypothetical protein